QEIKALSKAADTACEQFVKLYYETMEKRRHMVSKFYMDSSTLLWNGNPAKGLTEVTSFLENVPSTKYVIEGMDTHPMPGEPIVDQKSILVTTSGTVQYEDSNSKGFFQNFILTAQGTTWKIVSDSMRTFE
ncbi:hypothetical protein CAPTEDRAFT_106742, partial [Capitella teleta]